MSTDIRGKPGLPEEYWIENPNADKDQQYSEFTKAINSRYTPEMSGESKWYRIDEKNKKFTKANSSSDKPANGLPILTYEDWKRLISNDIGDYSVDRLKGKNVGIYCPTENLWFKVNDLLKSTGWWTATIRDRWHMKKENSCIIVNSTYDDKSYCERNGYQIISAESFLDANQPVEQTYKIGDRVERLAGEGHGYSQMIPIGEKGTVTEPTVKITEHGGKAIGVKWDIQGSYNCLPKNLKLVATTDEIAQQDGWKVDDKLAQAWLCTNDTYERYKGANRGKSSFSSDRKVKQVKEGWAEISGTADIWLAPKHTYMSLPEQKAVPEVPVQGNIGRKVRMIDGYMGYKDGEIGIVTDTDSRNEILVVKMPEGHTLYPFSPSSPKAQCEWVHIPENIPVTAENAYVGMRVVRGKDWSWKNQDTENGGTGVGTIRELKWGVVVDWENGKGGLCYSIGENKKYDLYIAPSESKQVNQINNNQLKTKTTENEYRKQQHTGKRSRWDIILPDSEEPIVSRSGGRTGTAGYSRGELPATQCGYKRVGKGIKGGQEITY